MNNFLQSQSMKLSHLLSIVSNITCIGYLAIEQHGYEGPNHTLWVQHKLKNPIVSPFVLQPNDFFHFTVSSFSNH